jgi:hypothetical protein
MGDTKQFPQIKSDAQKKEWVGKCAELMLQSPKTLIVFMDESGRYSVGKWDCSVVQTLTMAGWAQYDAYKGLE